MGRIAVLLAREDSDELARSCFEEAVEAARMVKDTLSRYRAFDDVATLQLEAGYHEQALQTAELIASEQIRARTVARIVSDGGQSTVQAAEAIAGGLLDFNASVEVRTAIAIVQAEALGQQRSVEAFS